MFGLFKSAPFSDPLLGELVHSRGYWRGTLRLGSESFKLALAGTRSAPDPAALTAAHVLEAQLSSWRSSIETALFEHYEPYAEAAAEGELTEAGAPFPNIAASPDVWPHVSLEFVSISLPGGVLTTELGYTTAWDEEHALGARFESGTLVELCGSVLPP